MFSNVAITIAVFHCVLAIYSMDELIPNRFEKGACWDLGNRISNVIKHAKCKPRDTLVSVIPEATNVLIIPNKVIVKRCDGSCFGRSSSCLPVEIEEIPIPVRKYDSRTKGELCGIAFVQAHKSCKCGCSVMSHHCTPRQYYDRNQCSCLCANQEEENQCINGKSWDPKNCSCVCKNMFPDCSSGTEWVPSMCKCMRIMMDYSNTVDLFDSYY